MKRILKYIAACVAMILIITILYYTYALYEAKKYTENVILTDFKKGQWRNLNGTAKKFKIVSSDLSDRQIEILIMVQDPGFYHHKGVDLSTPGAGLTTITQAIVKKLYFEHFTPGIAKIKQSLIARFVLNDFFPKTDQLTLFLNSMYFGKSNGNSVIGIESASKTYYKKSFSKLSEDEYISIIAMLIMPNTFHIIKHPEWNRDRVNRIKAYISGEYQPKGLMDQYYGKLPQKIIDAGLP